jgi:hypothetical protein
MSGGDGEANMHGEREGCTVVVGPGPDDRCGKPAVGSYRTTGGGAADEIVPPRWDYYCEVHLRERPKERTVGRQGD